MDGKSELKTPQRRGVLLDGRPGGLASAPSRYCEYCAVRKRLYKDQMSYPQMADQGHRPIENSGMGAAFVRHRAFHGRNQLM